MFKESSLKVYLVTTSLVFLFIILMINFFIVPKMEKMFAETSLFREGTIRKKISTATVISFLFVFLFNFLFWRVDDKLQREKRNLENDLKINPGDETFQEKLQQIEMKRKLYLQTAESIFTLTLGIIIGFIAVSLLSPIYRLFGTL